MKEAAIAFAQDEAAREKFSCRLKVCLSGSLERPKSWRGSLSCPCRLYVPGLVGPAVGGILVVSRCLHLNNEGAHCPRQNIGGTRPRFEKNDCGPFLIASPYSSVKRRITGVPMIDRFDGEKGRANLLAALQTQRLVGGQLPIAEQIATRGTLVQFEAGTQFITQGAADSDVFFIIAGSADLIVNNRALAMRSAGEHVGEMSVVEPSQGRVATLVTRETTVLVRITEDSFITIANQFPEIWRRVASTLAARLAQRNFYVTRPRERVRVFVMSSVESLPVTRLIVQHFEHDSFLAVVWNHGVFKASNYTLEDLENELDDSDFAIAVAHADDMIISRDSEWPIVRDNVIFELGMFIGRLGRRRAFLMEPRGAGVKLPSDLAGLNTIPFRYEPGKDASAAIAPACDRLRELILAAGPKH